MLYEDRIRPMKQFPDVDHTCTVRIYVFIVVHLFTQVGS